MQLRRQRLRSSPRAAARDRHIRVGCSAAALCRRCSAPSPRALAPRRIGPARGAVVARPCGILAAGVGVEIWRWRRRTSASRSERQPQSALALRSSIHRTARSPVALQSKHQRCPIAIRLSCFQPPLASISRHESLTMLDTPGVERRRRNEPRLASNLSHHAQEVQAQDLLNHALARCRASTARRPAAAARGRWACRAA